MNILAIDTNILISALIKEGKIREILENFDINLVFPEYGIEEIYSYKEEILSKAKIDKKEFDVLLLRLLRYVRLIPLDLILPFREEADRIIGHIDKEDAVFIATALAFNCPIWSDDKHFKKQSKIRVYNTKEMLYLLENET